MSITTDMTASVSLRAETNVEQDRGMVRPVGGGHQTVPGRLATLYPAFSQTRLMNVGAEPWVVLWPRDAHATPFRTGDTGAVARTVKTPTIWDSVKMQRLLSQPIGSPIELTPEEAKEVVRAAFGRRPNLPSGEAYVEEVRDLLGHSIIERLQRSDG